MNIDVKFDPYQTCDDGCSHDLACGALTTDILREDGPFEPLWPESAEAEHGLSDHEHSSAA